MLTAERLREVLDYDAETGRFTWRVKLSSRGLVGREAGAADAKGYVHICIDGRQFLAHRLAWLHVHGEWPKHTIDHMNGSKGDNRISNLRDVPHAVNTQNLRGPKSANASGFLGVYWHAKARKWAAMIGLHGVNKGLGLFSSPESAHAAYVEAKRRLHAGCTI